MSHKNSDFLEAPKEITLASSSSGLRAVFTTSRFNLNCLTQAQPLWLEGKASSVQSRKKNPKAQVKIKIPSVHSGWIVTRKPRWSWKSFPGTMFMVHSAPLPWRWNNYSLQTGEGTLKINSPTEITHTPPCLGAMGWGQRNANNDCSLQKQIPAFLWS